MTRHGLAIPLVMGILFAIGILTISMHFFSAQTLTQSHALSSAEIAYYVADFGAREGFLWVRRAVDYLNSSSPDTMAKSAKMPPNLQPFLEHFVKNDHLTEVETLDVPIDIPWAEKTLLAAYTPRPILEVKVSLKGQKPLTDPTGIPGLCEPSLERRGRFIIDAKASFRGVERRVVAFFEVRTLQLTWPVLGRFVLMASGLEGNLNPIRATRVPTSQNLPPECSDLPLKPLVIRGSSGFPTSKRSDIIKDVAGFLDQNGWIHLASPPPADPRQWTLGLAPTKVKDYGEGFTLTSGLIFWADIEKGKPFGFEARNPTNGEPLQYWKTHQTYSTLDGLYKETREAGRENFLLNDPNTNTQASSLLRLYGTPDLMSPTLVFGMVYRSYVVEQGLRKKASDTAPTPFTQCAPFPFVPQDGFDDVPWLPNYKTAYNQVIREACNNDWKVYREIMSFSQVSAYNEGLAYCLESQGFGDGVRPRSPSFSVPNIPKLGRGITYVDKNPEKLILDDKIDLRRGDAIVYSGELQQVLPNISRLALSRCGREFSSADQLKEYLLRVQRTGGNTCGYYHVKGPFDWTADWNPLALGGVGIVADSGISIKSRVFPQAVSPALVPDSVSNLISLVSLKGDIRIETGEEIRAALIAPSGKFIARGECRIKGLVAVQTLDLNALATNLPKVIEYDPVHDWCDREKWQAGFRLMIEDQPVFFVAKPK